MVGTCLTLPNLGFLWVFFKYPKICKNGNPLFFPVWEIGSRKSEVRSGKWEVGNQKSEIGIWKWEVGSGKWEVRRSSHSALSLNGQKSEIRSSHFVKYEVLRLKSEVRSQKSEDPPRLSYNTHNRAVC